MAYNVLIIEDDPMVADIISQFLLQIDSKQFDSIEIVSHLASVKKQIDLTKIDLMLIDVYLPDGKGTDFLAELRQENNSVFAIMITAADDRDSIRQAMTNGVVDYLIKPFQLKRFEQAIQKFLKLETISFRKKRLSQKEINQYFQGDTTVENQALDLPKGISELTLRMITSAILNFPEAFSNQALSQKVHLSRVTTKKYLDYLVTDNFLKVKVTYLEVGRPLSLYVINSTKIKALQQMET